jgi:hypothetical protein
MGTPLIDMILTSPQTEQSQSSCSKSEWVQPFLGLPARGGILFSN